MGLQIFLYQGLAGLKLSLFLVETLPFYCWTENDRFKEGSLDSFHVIPGSEQADEGTEEDGPATNPQRLHRVMRNQRESVAHFVSGSSHVQYTQTDTVRNYKFTIRTVWQIVKDSFRSVYNRKIVPH